jgi:eukaryotic-like serine/threonine-protein kinase
VASWPDLDHDRRREVTTFPATGSFALTPGTRLGPYQVLAPLGSGGMGEVYRARDERLGREVAVKILPTESSTDPDRLRRFEQEARAAGTLNHPNLVAVFDTGRHEGNPYVVFELLDGVTLRQRLAGGPLPARKAVDYAVQIAQGLAAAHEKGIVHRDLKPENLFVTRDGRVKILDFGLAKLRPTLDAHAPREEGATVSTATGAGVLLGTVGYMSPEQVRGEPADHRSDIFSFGSVFYEMLSGRPPFSGETSADLMTAILKEEPAELAKLDVPPGLERVVRRCLEKRPEERFQSARDIAFALEAASGKGAIERSRVRLGPIAAALAAGAVIGSLVSLRPGRPELAHEPATGVTRFTWSLPAGLELDSAPVVSPDSRSIAFTATDASASRLFVRTLDRLEASVIAGTEGAKQPFWSPDSRSLGYFANGSLMKVALASGAPVRICDAPEARGGTWSRYGVIVFAPALIHFALTRVSAEGGPAEPATVLDVSQGENSHRWPLFLPDGVHFLYFVRSSVDERRGVYLARVDRPASRPASPLFRSESEAVYAPLSGRERGVLLSVANGRVAARPFDYARLALDGDPRMIDLPAGGNTLQYPAMLGASADLLATVSSPIPSGSRLASSGRNGEDPRFWKERETQFWPRLSPDGRRLARQRIDVLRGNPALWVEDLERGTRVRVATIGLLPVWSPDGSQLAYLTGTRAEPHLSVVAADGTGDVAILPCPRAFCEPTDWSPDGGRLLVNVRDDHDHGGDVWAISTNPKGSAQPLLAEAFTERDARLSPDGRWIAYVSEESGRAEVSVRSVSGPLRRIVISGDGGDQPVWRRDGAELFFVDSQGRLRAVAVAPGKGANLTVGIPVELKVPPIPIGQRGTQYDVSPDGRRVYFLDRTREPAPREISVVLGWRALLRTASTQAEAGN